MKIDKYIGARILIKVKEEVYIGTLLKVNKEYTLVDKKVNITIKEEDVERVMYFSD